MQERISNNHALCIHVHTPLQSKPSEHKIHNSNRLSSLYGRALESLKQRLSPSCHLEGIQCRKIRKKIIISAVDYFGLKKCNCGSQCIYKCSQGTIQHIYSVTPKVGVQMWKGECNTESQEESINNTQCNNQGVIILGSLYIIPVPPPTHNVFNIALTSPFLDRHLNRKVFRFIK